MSLTEMVFEVGDSRHPLCRLSADHPSSRAVYRVLDADGGPLRATLTLLAPQEAAVRLAKDLRASGQYDELEILSLTPYASVFKLAARAPPPPVEVGPAPFERFVEVFGADTIFEPFFVERGRVRVRALVAEPIDTKRALVRLQQVQRAIAWQDFRVLRVAEYKAARYAESLRRILEPEQEELLSLAVRLGYYDTPKRCTLQDIADAVGLSVSPIHKKLKNVEQILVGAYVDPSTARVPDPRRRPRAPAPPQPVPPGGLAELSLRVLWPTLALADFSARHPGSLLLLHPLSEDAGMGRGSALLVVVAPAQDYRGLIDELRKRPEIERMDFISRDTDHVSLRVRWHVNGGGLAAQPFPLLRPLRRLGRDAHVKPLMIEAGEVHIKAILTHPTSLDEVDRRLKELADDAGWKACELVSLRPVEADPALSSSPTERMTSRQAEILKIAHALGYYRTPRGCTLDEVARTLGISANAIHKNLTAAEQKIVGSYLSGTLSQA